MKPESRYIYLSGAFSGLEAEAQRFWNRSKLFTNLAKDSGLCVLVPRTRHLYSSDLDLIINSELVVSFLDIQSLKAGAEIVLAYNNGVTVLGALPVGSTTSPFVEGFMWYISCVKKDWYSRAIVYRYNDLKDLVAVITAEIETPTKEELIWS